MPMIRIVVQILTIGEYAMTTKHKNVDVFESDSIGAMIYQGSTTDVKMTAKNWHKVVSCLKKQKISTYELSEFERNNVKIVS